MPDEINEWVVDQTPQIQAALNGSLAVQQLWTQHNLAAQQAFHDANPYIGAPLENEAGQILPWMPDWIGCNSAQSGILVVGSSYAAVMRPESPILHGYRALAPNPGQFMQYCAEGDVGHRSLYENHFWNAADNYYGPIRALLDGIFGTAIGKEKIVLTDVIRASLMKINPTTFNCQEFSGENKLKLFWEYLDQTLIADPLNGSVLGRIEKLLERRQRVVIVCLGWFAEHLVAALIEKHWAIWHRFGPPDAVIRHSFDPDQIPGRTSLSYSSYRNLLSWGDHPHDCWKWFRAADEKEIWMMPIYHPAAAEFQNNNGQILHSLGVFFNLAGVL